MISDEDDDLLVRKAPGLMKHIDLEASNLLTVLQASDALTDAQVQIIKVTLRMDVYVEELY